MSSIPAPPPPPALPPPAPTFHNSSTVFLSGSGAYPLLKLQQNAVNSAAKPGCPLGQTETKDVTEKEFIEELSKLVCSRLGGFSLSSSGQDDECKDTILMVVMPLNKPILQNGPMCGIVALAEALQIMKNNAYIDPKDILDEAVQREYTKQGEMFSIVAMQTLAEKFGNCQQSRVVESEAMAEECLGEFIVNLLNGFPALVPYDADYNHSPALRKGHAAHWAVIHGLATSIPSSKLTLMTENPAFKVLLSSQELTIIQPISQNQPVQDITEMFKTDSLHVIAHQGKSFRIGLWKYKDLIESNQNLKEMAPKILNNPSEFVFGDIVEGLCSKILLLK